MKATEKQFAKELRAKGWPLNKIQRKLGVSKSSISVWVRKVELTEHQKEKIHKGRFTRAVIERTRQTRLRNEDARRQTIINVAKEDLQKISSRELFLIGISLYWGEGGKTGGIVRFSNSDPKMIRVMMRFFRILCGVSEKKFRGYIHIHPHLDHIEARKYWSQISGIPENQFYKTYRIPSKASKQKKDSLPFGTFNIYICNKELLLKLTGWTEKVYELATSSNNTL
ncbi:MAG: hypothetical protein HYV78_01850 [Candidatus Wildermuthbacteria bacterium]|nr:hypothetical protein [Candidatus Wildermuthbacteria bacterium]